MLTNKFTGSPTRFLSACLFICASIAFVPFQQKDNTISIKEKKDGWKLLFDGKSTKGWRTYNNVTSDDWAVANGQLYCKTKGVTKRADLITNDKYDNFELSFDWKLAKGANSGVLYRVTEGQRPSYESGPEYQLIDDNGYEEKLEDWQKSGSDYAMHPPASLASNPPGEYNHSIIIVKGAHIEHWLNGVKVVDFESGTPEWQKRKEASKWKDAAEYGAAKSGHIGLQDHGGGTWFKNIKIRRVEL